MTKPYLSFTFMGAIVETDPDMPINQIDIIDRLGRRPIMVNVGLGEQPLPITSPAMVTLHHLAHSTPLCCDLCHEQIGWTWEFTQPRVMVYCSSCKDAPPSRLINAAKQEEKGIF